MLTKKEWEYLKVDEYNNHTIPKLHKSLTNPPSRPIVSFKGPLEYVGKYVDDFIKDLVTKLPSYVQDTRDVLTKLQNLEIPPGAQLVRIDVESLYTRFPTSGVSRLSLIFWNSSTQILGLKINL